MPRSRMSPKPDTTGFRAQRSCCTNVVQTVAFTAGLEAHSPTGEVYGGKRLRELLLAQRGKSASELVHAVLDAADIRGALGSAR